ncbi:T9SS C-terminal target domain-containing protein [Aquimarina sp. BL5]|uniref:endonuclease/exonuclease/phosphatase family protein n=1 Tax=Aquimarina sp. BL5 TaxID=1714860 RepID=UPI000E48A34F|nr:endonuclease/exonuclease/phosphatase family protein [Aquimarina sp. BL5]AXT49872.1 T9SS C-terminal target domain-containing protein [Aquimarina sp. BL5]RKN00841.1 T9SS C-terminal target domain-containing protein [Aquimarina sp. BL5]
MKNKKKFLLCSLIACCFFSVIEAQTSIKVMTFNKLFTTSNSSVLNVVRSSGADVIGIQESYGAARSIANSLGFYYHNISSSEAVVSRYPITSTNASGVQITLPNGLEVYVFNAHLTSYPYQPYDIRDGSIRTESQAISSANNTRSSEMSRIINTIQSWVPSESPVFFTGDFNEPSHLDWTQRAANAGIHAMKVAWPTSKQATAINMKDSWRSVYPNEVSRPGNTWTPNQSSNEVYDRIDIIYHRGNDITATEAVRFGPVADEAEVQFSGYTSDHRAAMVTYSLPETDNNDGDVSYGDNLLLQGSAEQSNLSSWTQVSGSQKSIQGGRNGYPSAQRGNYIFWFGNSSTGEVYQEIAVGQYADNIDAGKQSFLFNGFVRSYSGQDRSRSKVEYRDNNDNVLAVFDSNWRNNSGNWEQINDVRFAPFGTRKIRVVLLSQRNSGRSNDGYFDDVSLKTGTSTSRILTASTKRKGYQTVDRTDLLETNRVFQVWPNPVINNINFSIKEKMNGEIMIIDMIGRIKKKVSVNSSADFSISTAGFSQGLYILQFRDKKDNVYTERISIK